MNALLNPRISAKDRNKLKGALRRAFATSDLRRAIIQAALVEHSDPSRPRVKQWFRCNLCKQLDAKSYAVVDHILPVIPVDTSFESVGLDFTADRMWCDPMNLQALCTPCHDVKTKAEKAAKKALQPPKPKKPRRKNACSMT
jgi:5-methylcytosine-specific restriction endonuclease McrA